MKCMVFSLEVPSAVRHSSTCCSPLFLKASWLHLTLFLKAVYLTFSALLLWEWAGLVNDLKLNINQKLELYGHQ